MTDQQLVQQGFSTILEYFIVHGRAPHYTELAEALGIDLDQARELQRDAAAAAPAASCWLARDTDYIESWAPFSNLPTHFLVTVDGLQKWYGQ